MDYLTFARASIRGLTPYQPGKPIEELERELGITDIVKLASNENPLGCSPLAAAAIAAKAPELARYPDGAHHALKGALAEYHGLTPDHFVIGNGSNEVLALLARAFLEPGVEAVYSEFAFAVYPIVTQIAGATAKVAIAGPDFGHDLAAMLAEVSERTRLVFIANPNNPTGGYVTGENLTNFLDAVAKVSRDALVVLDEAYFEYVDRADYPDGLTLLADYPQLVITRTFSKIYGLAGLRVGYGIAHPDLIALLERVREPFNVNTLALYGAQAALADQDFIVASKAVNARGRNQLETGLAVLGMPFLPSVGNFVTFDCGGDGQEIYEALLREGVIVRPLAPYRMPRHLRVTVGTEVENARFLQALGKVLTAKG